MASKTAVVVVVVLIVLGGLVYVGSAFESKPNTSNISKSGAQSPLANSTLYENVRNNILDDNRISTNKTVALEVAVQLFTNLHYGTGLVKVLNPESGVYAPAYLTETTIQAFSNYSVALVDGLPKHNATSLFLLGNATQINPAIFDFAILESFPAAAGQDQFTGPTWSYNGSSYVLQDKNIARDAWMLAEHLERTPAILLHPEMYEALNILVRQESLVLFDVLLQNPASPSLWNNIIMPNWNYHWEAAPQEGNTSHRITLFPWYNSAQMSGWFPRKADRTIIEAGMWMPIQMAEYDAFTGNLTSPKLQTLVDNLQFVVNSTDWSKLGPVESGIHPLNFTGTLYQRIMKAFNDPTWSGYGIYCPPSYCPTGQRTDNELAWDYWNGRNGGNGVGPFALQDLTPEFSAFGLYYKPIVNETNPMLSLAFAYGLDVTDQAVRGIAEQWDVLGTMLYAKALGAAVFQGGVPRMATTDQYGNNIHCYVHQTVAIPVPVYIATKLPQGTIFGFGNSLSIGSNLSANLQSGLSYVSQSMPDGATLIVARYNSQC